MVSSVINMASRCTTCRNMGPAMLYVPIVPMILGTLAMITVPTKVTVEVSHVQARVMITQQCCYTLRVKHDIVQLGSRMISNNVCHAFNLHLLHHTPSLTI